MDKDFQKWHTIKEKIDHTDWPSFFFGEREVWWSSLGANVGDEENGKGDGFRRPILIFKKFSPHLLWGIPITTKPKSGRFYAPVTLFDRQPRTAILSQMKPLDSKRLIDCIGKISIAEYKAI